MSGFQPMFDALALRKKEAVDAGRYVYHMQIDKIEGHYIWVGGKKMMNFTTYNYLGLLGDPRVNEAAIEATKRYGTGSHGVRLLAGNTSTHVELERTIADFHNMDDAITYSSGYNTNLTTVSTLCGRGDVIFCDMINHASIVDGCLLSRAVYKRFKHNDIADLERQIKDTVSPRKLIVVDSVFSMDGDVTPLPDIIEVAKKHDCLLMVDESHSLGVLGKTGYGVMEYFGLKDGVDIIMSSMSKSIAITGGYIAARQEIIDYLRYISRAYVFSAPLPPGSAGAAKAAFDIIKAEPWRVTELDKKIKYYLSALNKAGFDTHNSTTAIVPIIIGDEDKTLDVTKMLLEEGVFLMPILPPAVEAGTSRLRLNITLTHPYEEIDFMVSCLAKAFTKLGLPLKLNALV